MDQGEFTLAGRLCLRQAHFGQLGQDRVAQHAVFLHRETVSGRQREYKMVSVVGAHRDIVTKA